MHQRIVNFINGGGDLDFGFFNVDLGDGLGRFDGVFEFGWSREIFHSLMNNNNQKTINNIRNIKL